MEKIVARFGDFPFLIYVAVGIVNSLFHIQLVESY